MSDNTPTNILKNIPPYVVVQAGNNGDSFVLPSSILQYSGTYLAQEVPERDPIEQETGDDILI